MHNSATLMRAAPATQRVGHGATGGSQEHRFVDLMDRLYDGAALVRRDGTILYISKGMHRLVGATVASATTASELLTRLCLDPEECAGAKRQWQQFIVASETSHVVFSCNNIDGDQSRLRQLEFVSLDQQHLIIVAKAVSEQQSLRQLEGDSQEPLVSTTDCSVKLNAAGQELEALATVVAHEMRTHLQAIEGYTSVLSDGYADALDEEGRSFLAKLQRTGTQMTGLVDELLGMARVARTEIMRTQVNLSDLVLLLVRELRETYPDRTIDVDVTPGLQANCDGQLMRVAFKGLLESSIRRCNGNRRIHIQFGARGHNGAKQFYFHDNGPQHRDTDIPLEQRSIGVAAAIRIIDRHGGSLRVDDLNHDGLTLLLGL